MTSIDLDVPYRDRNLAKTLGARWDAQRQVWYISAHRDLTPFQRWLRQPPRINHRSASYLLLRAHRSCWKCQMQTQVFGFALPIGHEALEDVGDENEIVEDERHLNKAGNSQWVHKERPEVVCYATFICEGALARMGALTHRYRKDFSATTGTRYYMNHCEYCDAKLGDFETIEEFDAPLTPLNAPAPDRLQMIPGSGNFEAESGTKPLPFASLIE